MTNNYSVEITRRNVTLAKFFAEIRFALKKKGIDFALEMDDFANPTAGGNDSRYHVKDGVKTSYFNGCKTEWPAEEDSPWVSEICRNRLYDHQTYILNIDGSCYNEICEFTFHDEKTGTGYYYTMNKDAE